MNTEINRILQLPDIKARLDELGVRTHLGLQAVALRPGEVELADGASLHADAIVVEPQTADYWPRLPRHRNRRMFLRHRRRSPG